MDTIWQTCQFDARRGYVSQYVITICVSIHNACLPSSSATGWLNISHSTWDEL